MICGYCNREIPAKVPESGCGRCGGGCRKVHCPYCGYENPAPSGMVERLFGRKDKSKKEDE